LSAIARRTGPAPQRAAATWPPCAAPTARVKALSGRRRVPTARIPRPRPPRLAPCAASRPPRPRRRQPPRERRRRPDRPCPRARCPSHAVAAAAASRARPSPIAVTPRRRLHAGEPPPPRRLRAPASSRRPSPSSAATHCIAVRRAHARAAWPRPSWASAAHALCVWAESDFGPVAPG
jgi:hypothetical protein